MAVLHYHKVLVDSGTFLVMDNHIGQSTWDRAALAVSYWQDMRLTFQYLSDIRCTGGHLGT